MVLLTSARNRLPGRVTSVRLGGVMAQVEIQVGENLLSAVITRDSAEELALKEGDEVVAIVKSTEVMVGKAGPEEVRHGR
jgi:molybdopterin-binding protein